MSIVLGTSDMNLAEGTVLPSFTTRVIVIWEVLR